MGNGFTLCGLPPTSIDIHPGREVNGFQKPNPAIPGGHGNPLAGQDRHGGRIHHRVGVDRRSRTQTARCADGAVQLGIPRKRQIEDRQSIISSRTVEEVHIGARGTPRTGRSDPEPLRRNRAHALPHGHMPAIGRQLEAEHLHESSLSDENGVIFLDHHLHHFTQFDEIGRKVTGRYGFTHGFRSVDGKSFPSRWHGHHPSIVGTQGPNTGTGHQRRLQSA